MMIFIACLHALFPIIGSLLGWKGLVIGCRLGIFGAFLIPIGNNWFDFSLWDWLDLAGVTVGAHLMVTRFEGKDFYTLGKDVWRFLRAD